MQDLKNHAIKEGYFETEEGADVFRKAFEEALKTRSARKRQVYAQILRGAVLDFGRKEYSAEEYLHLLSDLKEQEITLGFLLYRDNPGNDVGAWGEWKEGLCEDLGVDVDDFSMILARVAATGLIEQVLGTSGTRRYIGSSNPGQGIYRVTPAFAKIMRFLDAQADT